jgi:WD40 repeat protein
MPCIFVFDLSSADISYPDPDAAFVRGIAACPATDHICVGTSNGNIFAFSVAGESIELARTMPPHGTDKGACTSSIDTSGDYVAVASDSGSLLVMNATEAYDEVMFFSFSAPCTCVAASPDFVVAGYATGMLRVLRLDTRAIYAEIGGHSRCVMALDMHPEMRRFASVGLDSVITVWDLPSPAHIDEEEAEVRVAFTDLARDATFVGVQFSRNGTADLIATCYDQRQVRAYPST